MNSRQEAPSASVAGGAPRVYGAAVDDATRCIHYHSPTDVIAIKFACCRRYYPCFQCHAEVAPHEAQQWPHAAWSQKAILCGACHTEMSIEVYQQVTQCPQCNAQFNSGCRLHAHLYFDASE